MHQEMPTISPSVLASLERRLPDILRELVQTLAAEAPEYAAYLAGEAEDVDQLARNALHRLVSMVDAGLVEWLPGGAPHDELGVDTFEELGRHEYRSGHGLRTLLAAYRVGARVAWRHIARTAIHEGVTPEALAALAEAVFAFVDDLSGASARGYAEEQSASSAERERRLLALSDLLLSPDPHPAALESATTAAGWPWPETLALVLAPEHPGEHDLNLANRLGAGALPVRLRGLAAALVADPAGPGRRPRIAQWLRGRHAVVGLPSPTSTIAGTAPVTELALSLVSRGVLPDADPLFVDDHLGTLVVHRDARLLEALRHKRLAPLAELPPSTRLRLAQTLQAWLDLSGERRAVADRLQVHPQTVRYRVGQLRQVFGSALDSPQDRFELAVVLRGELGPGRDA